MAEHRCCLRIVYNKRKEIVEKILTITDGHSWQKWILTVAAYKTGGFGAGNPYWELKQPHFDRKELLQWATRPPMINAIATSVANTPLDAGKPNLLIDQGFQFSCRFGNTDGRITVPGGWSLPVLIKSEDFNNNPNFLPKNINVKFYAGSPLTEFVDIFVRKSSLKTTVGVNQITWGDWLWVERVYKFGHDPNVLSSDYWLRRNPFANYNYDTVYNTFDYNFDNSRLCELIDQSEFLRLQNDIPQLSYAQVTLDDTQGLGNNRVDYDNAPQEILDKFSVEVKQKQLSTCPIPLRHIRLYVYVGRDKGYGSTGHDDVELGNADNIFRSQFGYFNGDDIQMRFGGIWMNQQVEFDIDESKTFNLDFADNESFRAYLKGTPYSAVAKWYTVANDADFTLTPVDGKIDASSSSSKAFVTNAYVQLSFFVGVFDFYVPAGRYVATLGRHNVASNGDYRGQSTYIQGIANSRLAEIIRFAHEPFVGQETRVVRPLVAIVDTTKEMEIDCTNQDFDPWGNGRDLFYINCPFIGNGKRNNTPSSPNFKWQWVEGYLYESQNSKVPVELFPYALVFQIGQCGFQTDKNGFFFAYTWGQSNQNRFTDLRFTAKMNCAGMKEMTVPNFNPDVSGWKSGNSVYISDFNGGQFGAANRILYFGRITNLDGTIGYSNIGVTIKDGETVYSGTDGNFSLIIHNGEPNNRVSNVYVTAGGNFRISRQDCGQIPLFNFNESLVACSTSPTGNNPCTGEALLARIYPTCLQLAIRIEGGTDTSLKENASYSIGFACADLAGRLMAVNVIDKVTVPSYLETGEVVATYFQLILSTYLQYSVANPDMKWFAPYVSPKVNIQRYLQWVGDKIQYVNANGDIVGDPSTAVLVKVTITSLYNYNVSNNFSLLSSWQFTNPDRLRVLDNGEGQIFDIATYGEPIDVQVLGTNYNQAIQNSGILSDSNGIQINALDTTTTPDGTDIAFYVKYDSRFDKLVDKTGFWIELYTPLFQKEKIPYSELKWYPLINGQISEFTGFVGNQPTYNLPLTLDLTYWDTYLFSRNISIPGIGSKFFDHAFCSPNVSDSWGYNLTSGGRLHFRNDNAHQMWKPAQVTKSDKVITEGIINGIGTFRGNVSDFSNNNYGQILAIISQRSIVLFICQNDWFTTNYNFQYAYANEQGQVVVNTGENLSRPIPKIGNNYGMQPDDTGSVSVLDKIVCWYDKKNESFVMCDYRSARDITDLQDNEGRHYGINSYLVEKNQFISEWNEAHKTNSRFDIVTGIDARTNRIYLTFRPRRINSNKLQSFVNNRRNIDIKNQETFCFDFDQMRWISMANFTPEGYGRLRGLKSGVEMISFAAGKPYYHLNTPNDSFLNYYGIQTAPTIIVALNGNPEMVKTFMSFAQDILPNQMYVDLVFDNEKNCFSYVPANQIVKKENVYYGSFLRDMSSYNNPVSTLIDGKRIFSRYAVVRFMGRLDKNNDYFQLSNIFCSLSDSPSNKK